MIDNRLCPDCLVKVTNDWEFDKGEDWYCESCGKKWYDSQCPIFS